MLRTIFMVGLFAVLGIIALNVVFGVLGALLGIFWVLLWWAVKILILGAILYFIIRIFSPDTARKMKDKWSGSNI